MLGIGGMRWVRYASSIAVACATAAACSQAEPLQGEPFLPRGEIPIDPASVREAGTCEAGACTADADAPLPVRDAGLDAAPPATATNTCATARDLGPLDGDDPSPPVTATGTCAEFVRVRVVEANSSAVGAPMRLRVTLSPAGHDFDLYAFLDTVRDQLACGTPLARSETNGNTPETITLQWGEGSVANGNDDGRTVVLGIASASGPCPPGSSWSLVATGNP